MSAFAMFVGRRWLLKANSYDVPKTAKIRWVDRAVGTFLVRI